MQYATTNGQYQSGTSSNNRNVTRSAARHQANTDLPGESDEDSCDQTSTSTVNDPAVTVSEEQARWFEDSGNWESGRYDGPWFPGVDELEADYLDNMNRSQNAFVAHGFRISGQQE